jgi:uncharacterized protein YcbX
MITVEAIHISPVKSLGLMQQDRVSVGSEGIIEDRRFHLIDQRGVLLTLRESGSLAQVKAAYQVEPERLSLQFPGDLNLDGPLELGEAVTTNIFGRNVAGHVVLGDWNAALSDLCARPVRLVRSDHAGQVYDEYPLSVLSQASVGVLRQLAGPGTLPEGRRFRPNFLLSGCEPHQEDTWIGDVIHIGEDLQIRVVARDPRCAVTTLDPDTGERDVDTLRMILSYRPSRIAAYFGVFGVVENPGTVSLGDVVSAPSSSQ